MIRTRTTYLLILRVASFFLFSCDEASKENEFNSLGGVEIKGKVCPSTYDDVIVDLASLQLEEKGRLKEVSFESIMAYMEQHEISTITGLLNSLPDHYRNNFSLVEHTRGEGQSDLNFPRIVLFGPDGRFMLNVGTKPEDPKYNLLDGAELNSETGHWEFSQLDFTKRKPMLIKEPNECKRCHGRENPRPIWGTSLDWPGVFGDNEAPGMTGDALSMNHIRRMNEIRNNHGGSDRFDFLEWKPKEKLMSGGFRRIANNAFGPELLVSNLIIGSATGRGAFLRLKSKNPEKYQLLREQILLAAFEEHQLESKPKLNRLLFELGLDVNESFSLATLSEEEEPNVNWSLGDGDLYEQIYLQVLHDLSESDPEIRKILTNTPSPNPIFNCPDIVQNIQQLIDYKMLHLYYLKGKQKYEVNKVYYPLEVERVFELVMEPVSEPLINYLNHKINQ